MVLNWTEEGKEENHTESWLKPFHVTGLFLHILETSGNL